MVVFHTFKENFLRTNIKGEVWLIVSRLNFKFLKESVVLNFF